ncbi:MAG: RNA polymerase factor sigma-54 [Phycisphaerae bacterium]
MRLDTFQQLKLEQKLKLAPRMIQSMEILQLPLAALEERLAQELEKNPTLEMAEPGQTPEELGETKTTEDSDTDRDLVIDAAHDNKEDFNRLDNIEDAIAPDDYYDRPRISRSSGDDEDPKMQAIANTAARDISLHEFLTYQWDMVEIAPAIRQAGEAIINHIEPDGYLKTPFDQLAVLSDLPGDPPLWESALLEVQQLEPAGVGARDARECLLLQLDALAEDRPIERNIITNYFTEVQNQHFQKVIKQTGYSIEQIKSAVEFIKTRLVLHPGLSIGSAPVAHIVPDVILEYDEDGTTFKVIVPDHGLPRLYVSGHYRKMLMDPGVDVNTRRFIKNNIQAAHWIIDAVEQRRETLRKVAQVIVDAQREFLENGPKFLKPLPMAQVADKVGIHVATVSRAVSEKYILTPRGMYPLRSFFIGGTETDSGESVSWDTVRVKIQELINAEEKTNPLADDEIIKRLKNEGITLARRTVAKYRKTLGIPSSHKRREK